MSCFTYVHTGIIPGGIAAGLGLHGWVSLGGPALAEASRRLIRVVLGVALVMASFGIQPAAAATLPAGIDAFETPAGVGSDGELFNRSHSLTGGSSIGSVSQPKNVTRSKPGLQLSFDGLDHFDQRWGSDAGGNQYSLEPPDQGLCVGSDGAGNVRVVEVINDVFQVYDTSGNAVNGAKPQALNGFLGYAPQIVRGTANPFGPFVTDPSCLYDTGTGRWFVLALTLDSFTAPGPDALQHYYGTNHLDIRHSLTSDPTGPWSSIFQINVTDDGTGGTPNDGCSQGPIGTPPGPGTHLNACLADYPHIGSNLDGIFVTTNEYSFFGNEFHGSHIYAMSKAQLLSGGAVQVATVDTRGLDTFGFGLNGFTVWPSVTPTATGLGGGDPSAGGTEYFLSSNAAAEAHDTGDGTSTFQPSTQLLQWSLTNTSSLGSVSTLPVHVAKVGVGIYAPPPKAVQKSGNVPLRDCLNSNPCNAALNGTPPKDPFVEKTGNLDSNDSRIQQVTYFNGSLWGALDTALATSNGKEAGIEWFKVSVATDNTTGSLSSSLASSGYVALGNDNLTYPAIGITTNGNGVMAFTVTGTDFYPSAGYALIGANGVSDVHIAAAGAGPEDGFNEYRIYANGPAFNARPRWGDYGAAVAWGNNVWLASEYIGQSCDFSTYKATGFLCNNTRSALANWGTRISLVSAG